MAGKSGDLCPRIIIPISERQTPETPRRSSNHLGPPFASEHPIIETGRLQARCRGPGQGLFHSSVGGSTSRSIPAYTVAFRQAVSRGLTSEGLYTPRKHFQMGASLTAVDVGRILFTLGDGGEEFFTPSEIFAICRSRASWKDLRVDENLCTDDLVFMSRTRWTDGTLWTLKCMAQPIHRTRPMT